MWVEYLSRVLVGSALTLLLPNVSLGQDVGMGQREGSGDRFEAPYTFQVETAHVDWAQPLPGGPIRLLAVPSVQEGRTLVELAQRINLDLTTVTIDPSWDINKWTMCFGGDYGARAERGDLGLIYGYLEEEMTGEKEFDVILLPLHHGWEALTPKTRSALLDRVRNGCGLILIRPFDREISPLIPPVSKNLEFDSYREVEPDIEQGRWTKALQHYVTRGIPIEEFPFDYLENYRYELASDSKLLVANSSGTPVLAIREFGKGRVLALGYRNLGISWRMKKAAATVPVDLLWEYYYSLMVRSILYAAGLDTRAPAFGQPDTLWVLRSETGAVVHKGEGQTPAEFELSPGRYFLEQFLDGDWKITPIIVEQTDSIEDVRVGSDVISRGKPVSVKFRATGPAKALLMDGYGRVIARADTSSSGNNTVLLEPGLPMTHGGFLRIEVGSLQKRFPVRFAAASREWEDYEVILPWYGPRSYQPWTSTLDRQFREIGVTTLADPERNFKIIASVHEPVFGIYWYRKEAYEKRKKEYLKTGDKSVIRRNISLHSTDLKAEMRRRFKERVGEVLPLGPFAYYLADESSLTCYADAFDVDFSPRDLTAFRTWLQEEYTSLEALNQSWGTSFGNWDLVTPMTTRESQNHGNFASWSDHRVFMEEAFVRTIAEAGKMAREFDPKARASFSGTQIPAPHNGANWYEIDQVVDYLQPYSGGNQDAMHYLFQPKLRLTGFTGYGLIGTDIQAQVWRRLFYGHSGASIFWHYTLLNPDLSLSLQGAALAKVFGSIQSGIGRIFMSSEVIEDGVAIHFSMPSIRGAWITDGKIVDRVVSAQRTSEAFAELMERRDQWVNELEDRGIQFRFLATQQIESGELSRCKILILPYSIALSDSEIEEIERFAAAGGLVYLDEQTGRMDERLHWRSQQPWNEKRKNFIRSGPESLELTRAVEVRGDFLTTIRRFGSARLWGLLPKKKATIRVPKSRAVQYDLLRGGRVATEVEFSPEEPLLVLERDCAVASIEILEDLSVLLKDEEGQPVGRSVVSMSVRDPDGNRVHYYSKNIDVQNGRGTFDIPFAQSDPNGNWRLIARDAVSGLETELVLKR